MWLVYLPQIVINGVSLSSIYVLIALGFTLLFGVMRVVNFAHGSFSMLGGYALYYVVGKFQVPYLIGIPLAAAVVAVLALPIEWLVYRRFYQRMFQSMIGLLGLDMVLVFAAVLIWDAGERSVPSVSDDLLEFGGLFLPEDRLIVACISLVTLVMFYLFMRFTFAGLAMRAAAENPQVAAVQGIRIARTNQLAFFVATFITALAGGLYAQIYSLSPFMGERPMLVAFIATIVGGMGSIPGAALGGLLLGFSESAVSTLYGATSATFASFAIVIVLLIIRPWGFFGVPER